MKKKNFKKHLICIILIFAYFIGSVFMPTLADNGVLSGGFDDLLQQRDQDQTPVSNDDNDAREDIPQEKTVSISDFTDIKEQDWYYPYLERAVNDGIIKGKTPSTFEPQSSFSYAECSTVIARYLRLEDEAEERRIMLSQSTNKGCDKWYSGYLQLMCDLGIFDSYGVFTKGKDGLISIDENIANSPISRYRFAESISKSFQLDVQNLFAKNIYSEIGGKGHEFILAGGYKGDILKEYQTKISDFADIPQQSQEFVLKAYYNGIFNGDISGNFYPHNNLTRAEMVKVLTSIYDLSYRKRLISDSYAPELEESDYFTDSFGEKTVSYKKAQEILADEALFLHVENSVIDYSPSYNAPLGYAIDVYVYESDDGAEYALKKTHTLHNSSVDGEGFILRTEDDFARVLLVLRNVESYGKCEGVLDIKIQGGKITDTSSTIRQM